MAYSFLLSPRLANIFLSLFVSQGSQKDSGSDFMCRTPALIGGNAVQVRIRRLAAELPFNFALDPDLGQDPNHGSAVSAGPDSV